MSHPTIKLYHHPLSGHCHRVRLFLSILGIPTELIDVDLMQAEHKTAAFLEKNSLGQVPVIDDNGFILADSTAILVYVAKKYGSEAWLPNDAVGAAQVQRWLSIASGPIAQGPAVARLITVFGAKYNPEEAIARAHHLLKVIEWSLNNRDYLVGTTPTIADIAAYTYVAHAPEGNVSLADYPNIRSWLTRIEGLQGFVPMQISQAGLVT